MSKVIICIFIIAISIISKSEEVADSQSQPLEEYQGELIVKTKKFRGFYKGLPIVLMSSSEYKETKGSEVDKILKERARAVCKSFGLKDLASFEISESSINSINGYYVKGGTLVKAGENLAWSKWTAVTAFVGAPVWYNFRVLKSINCIE